MPQRWGPWGPIALICWLWIGFSSAWAYTLDFESSATLAEQLAPCGVSGQLSHRTNTPLMQGSRYVRTGQLSDTNTGFIELPWIDLPAGSKNLTFLYRLENNNSSNVQIRVQIRDGSTTSFTTLTTYNSGNTASFGGPYPSTTETATVNLSSYTGPHRIRIEFGGTTGGSSRAHLDDFQISGNPLDVCSIQGSVFEDPNYGGGAGRSLAASSGNLRSGVRVELYTYNGSNYVYNTAQLTNGSGLYRFTGLPSTTDSRYLVRVVNNYVTSARTGGCTPSSTVGTPPSCTQLPVQTFRTDATSGSPTAVTNRVGGQNPAVADAANGVSGAVMNASGVFSSEISGTAQSIALVRLDAAEKFGVDFGFNFSTVVNTSNSGQGSLRQFVTNANALGGKAGLAQVGSGLINDTVTALPAGFESSIFMIPNGVANPGQNTGYANQLSSGVAVIALSSGLSVSAANVRIDGSTQTVNVRASAGGAETNPGTLGTGGTVGVQALPLPLFQRPEVQINGADSHRLQLNGANSEVLSIAFSQAFILLNANNTLARDNLVGMTASGNSSAATSAFYGIELESGSGMRAIHNFVTVDNSGIRSDGPGNGLLIQQNEVARPASDQGSTYDGILLIGSATNSQVIGNLTRNHRGSGMEFGFSSSAVQTGTLVENNTIQNNGFLLNGNPSTENMGLVVWDLASTSQNFIVRRNIISGNGGPGALVMAASRITFTLNAFSNNRGLAIDLDPNARDPNGYATPHGVTPNNGTRTTTLPNQDVDYPLFSVANLQGGLLNFQGFIGSTGPASTFGGATIEVFRAQDDGNNNGPVIVGDGLNRPHGEAGAFVGSFTAAADGSFNATISAGSVAVGDVLTATATDTLGNTSEFTANFVVTASAGINGVVFADYNTNGLQDPGEPGLPNVPLTATSGVNTLNTTSGPNGAYAFTVPSGFGTNITVAHTRPIGTGKNLAGGSVALANGLNDLSVQNWVITGFVITGTYNGYNFGIVEPSRFFANQNGFAPTPGTLIYSHFYRPGAFGNVSIVRNTGAFVYDLRRDVNCDGDFADSGEGFQAFPLNFVVDATWPTVGTSLQTCAIDVRVQVPANQPIATVDSASITATLVWPRTLPQPLVSDPITLLDITTVQAGSGNVTLQKQVRNITQGGSFGNAISGRPGDTLEYCITYRNLGTDPITQTRVTDAIPFFTVYLPGSITLNGNPLTDAADTDRGEFSTGAIRVWAGNTNPVGTVLPGELGVVCYRVTIN